MSYSDDDSDSASSYSEDDYDVRYPVSAAPARVVAAPSVRTPVPIQQQKPIYSLPRQVKARAPNTRFNSQLAPIGKGSLLGREPDTVTWSLDLCVPLKELLAQADGGKSITLKWKDGISSVFYSNPLHGKQEVLALGDIDILCGDTEFTQTNTLQERLLTTSSIPMPYSTARTNAKTEKAPYGFLNFECDHDKVAKFERTLTPIVREFIETYPGQTADDLDNFLYSSPDDKDGDMHVQVNPPAAVLHFYNNMAEVLEKGLQVTAAKGDEKGRAYINKELGLKAKAVAKEQMRAGIAYCNVTDPMKQEFTVAMPFVNTRTTVKVDNVMQTMVSPIQKSLATVMKSKIGNTWESLREKGLIAARTNTAAIDVNNTDFHYHATLKARYFKIDKNFEYV